MAYLPLRFPDAPANLGHQANGRRAAGIRRERLHSSAAKDGFVADLFFQPRRGAVDDVESVGVAGPGVLTPREKTVTLEDHAAGARILAREFLQPQAQLEARLLP